MIITVNISTWKFNHKQTHFSKHFQSEYELQLV